MAKDPIPSLEWPSPRKPSLALALLEIAALFTVLAWLLFSGKSGILIVLVPSGVVAIYLIWAIVAAILQTSASLPSPLRIVVFSISQLVGGTIAVAGLARLLSGAWGYFSYRVPVIDPIDFDLAFPLNLSTAVMLAPVAVLAGLAVFFLAVPLLRRDHETVGQCFAGIGVRGVGALWPALVAWLLIGLAVNSLAAVVGTVAALPPALRVIDLFGGVTGWRMAVEFPGFAGAVLASAVFIVAFRRMQPAALLSLRVPSRVTRPGILSGAAVVGGIGAISGWHLYILHIGMIVALGASSMIVGWGDISRATDAWIDRQVAAGRNPGVIATDLRDYGRWSMSDPASGLPEIFPELGRDMNHLALRPDCTVTIDAGVADNTALPADRWLEGYVAVYRPLPEVSYCIRLACPSPVVWHDHSIVIFHSSHPSRSGDWAYNLYMDYTGAGRATSPGGYCTETGDLADSYQG